MSDDMFLWIASMLASYAHTIVFVHSSIWLKVLQLRRVNSKPIKLIYVNMTRFLNDSRIDYFPIFCTESPAS